MFKAVSTAILERYAHLTKRAPATQHFVRCGVRKIVVLYFSSESNDRCLTHAV